MEFDHRVWCFEAKCSKVWCKKFIHLVKLKKLPLQSLKLRKHGTLHHERLDMLFNQAGERYGDRCIYIYIYSKKGKTCRAHHV